MAAVLGSREQGEVFYQVQKEVGKLKTLQMSRREQTAVSRLRLGHTGLNRALFLIDKHPLVSEWKP